METFKGKINEFIDWTTGVNELTGNKIQGVSDQTPISGQSIRELLLSKLKTPFVTETDDKLGKILFFSSEESKNIYKNYIDAGDEISLEKANDLILYDMDMPSTFKITGLSGLQRTRYIIEGNSESSQAILDITLGLEDSVGNTEYDSVTLTILIEDTSNNILYYEPLQVETGLQITKKIYSFLKPGENRVTVSANARNHAAVSSVNFSIFVVTFSISSNFVGYYNPLSDTSPILFDVYINRSITTLKITTEVYIDGRIALQNDINHSNAVFEYKGYTANPTLKILIYNQYSPSTISERNKHVMKVLSYMVDQDTGNQFYSNILMYEFEIAPSSSEITHKYVNLAQSIQNDSYSTTTFIDVDGKLRVYPIIKAVQYFPIYLDWGYSTDHPILFKSENIHWFIRTGLEGQYVYEPLAILYGQKEKKPDTLTFIPSSECSFEEDNSYLVACTIDDETRTELSIYPIDVEGGTSLISEYGNYSLKLSAFGKTNLSDDKNKWEDLNNSITTTFSSGVTFDSSNGWNNNSLLLKGVGSYATINYCPFPETYNGSRYDIGTHGATFEIDFKPEYISSNNDELIVIGKRSGRHIRIMPETAGYYDNNSPIVKTNYKSGERIKLAFIFNKDVSGDDSGLVFIVNNGILERAAERGNYEFIDNNGKITIGGTNSSIRVYMIRAYRFALSPRQCLENYIFDNSSDVSLISRNDVYKGGSEILYRNLYGKQDIITIEGDLSLIIDNSGSKENATVRIGRLSNSDTSKNFEVLNCRIRNHGQSTLEYPRTSMKIWLNKSNLFNDRNEETVPTFSCPGLRHLGLNKNRYVMKNGAIPSNKFVLLANYADSSGTHNGSFLRLILDTWYDAKFGDTQEYKLRTAPQLFTSGTRIHHDNTDLGEINSWTEGEYNIPFGATGYNESYVGKTWTEIVKDLNGNGLDFPYKIRVSADSFPCVVFYKNTGQDGQLENSEYKLLGQYVFMDDKKSDFIYGERSIYKTDDTTDPFCLKTDNSKKDKKENKVWDNSNVLLIEVVFPNSPLTSYVEKEIAENYTLENDVPVADPNSPIRRFDYATKTDSNNHATEYLWEQHFDLIYPDKEDIKDDNGNFDAVKFEQTVAPFHRFLNWITDVAALRNQGTKGVINGETYASGSKSYVTQDELDRFITEAHNYLDLYKLAAYYVFFLRFGLIDSVERNAQLKTYDGLHWHYEPWDMDIALGCANSGVIAYEPPLTRDTRKGGEERVYSGRIGTQSNVLWDCLESWDYWMETLVPEVAQALYDAGLTYDNCIKMLDGEYELKWSESIYNVSGHYKYIEATKNANYRLYLNGARTSHRHWWLSKSMNYYDAKWQCGDFKKYTIVFRIGKNNDPRNLHSIKITPTQDTYFAIKYSDSGVEHKIGDLTHAGVNTGEEAVIHANTALSDKQFVRIYGANSISKLDIGSLLDSGPDETIGSGLVDINFSGSYDPVLGAQIREIRLGAPCKVSPLDDNFGLIGGDIYSCPDATVYESNVSVGNNAISGLPDTSEGNEVVSDAKDALENLEFVDVIGLNGGLTSTQTAGFLSNLMNEGGIGRKNIHTLYALGCNKATEFATSSAGNNFVDLRLPDTVRTLVFSNSTWQNISFWHTESIGDTKARYTKINVGGNGIPASIDSIRLSGSTARNECALKLVKDWISAIEREVRSTLGENEDFDTALRQVLSEKTLVVENAYWGRGENTLTYDDVLKFRYFGNNSGGDYGTQITGYVLLQGDLIGMTPERVARLIDDFGPNVFRIGSVTSSLVVDYQNSQVVIGISGNAVSNVGGVIQLTEPNEAILSATSFTLTSDNINNYIADNGTNNPDSINSYSASKYIWGIVDGGLMKASVGSSRLEVGGDGFMRLRTVAGNGNDYDITIRVKYGVVENGQVVSIQLAEIQVRIISVTYPSTYNFNVSDQNPNTIKYSRAVAKSLFGNDNGNTYADSNQIIYVFRNAGQIIEFSLNPSTPKYNIDGQGNRYENWTADESTEVVQYLVLELGNADQATDKTTEYMNKSEFATNDNKIINIGSLGSDYAYVTDGATNGGIRIKTKTNLPQSPVLFKIWGKFKIGGKEEETKYTYFMVINDNNAVIAGNTSNVLSNAMWAKYTELYSITGSNIPQNLYRYQLLGLTGTLSFTNYTNIPKLITDTNYTVLKYIPYINIIDFSGCTNISKLYGGVDNNFDFTNNSAITTLNFTNCTGLNQDVLDLTPCTNLTTLTTTGSNVGVILPANTVVSTLNLGSPNKLVIDGATTLTSSGVSITSSSNLTELLIKNVNSNNVCGYTLFDTIYNTQQSNNQSS